MAAERRGAAGLDSRHHLELAEADVAGMGGAPGRTVPAKDVGNFQRGTRHRIRLRVSVPSISSLRRSSGLVTGPDRASGHAGVQRGRIELGMAEQDLG